MIVGLTGGIGSGKSTIAKLFEIFGCIVFDSDSVAKQLYFDPIIKSHIIKLLGEESYVSENKINKKYISSIIFSNSNKLEQLNQIIHPAVIIELKKYNSDKPSFIKLITSLNSSKSLLCCLKQITFIEAPNNS